MTRLVLYLFTILILFLPKDNTLIGAAQNSAQHRNSEQSIQVLTELEALELTEMEALDLSEMKTLVLTEMEALELTEMEALDLVKERYADNFKKVIDEQDENSYYYKLPDAEYYLVYEGVDPSGNCYLFHFYEFVLDETESGVGHLVTYGWYFVEKKTGIITDETN